MWMPIKPYLWYACLCFFCRDLAVIVASMAYNTWFTKLYCKDMRIVTILSSASYLPSMHLVNQLVKPNSDCLTEYAPLQCLRSSYTDYCI